MGAGATRLQLVNGYLLVQIGDPAADIRLNREIISTEIRFGQVLKTAPTVNVAKAGDFVMFHRAAGIALRMNGEPYIIIPESGIIGGI